MGVYGRCELRREQVPAAYASAMALQSPPVCQGVQQVPAGKKTTLRAPRWRSSRGTAPHRKTSPAAQRTVGHRRVATRKTTGDLTTAGSRRPRDGRWWDTDRVRPKRALVQAIVVVLHEPTGWGARRYSQLSLFRGYGPPSWRLVSLMFVVAAQDVVMLALVDKKRPEARLSV